MRELSETIDRKYIDSIDLSDWEIETDTGWEDLTSISQTVIYDEWYLETENGLNLTCADTHIVFDNDYNQVFVKDLIPNISRIITKNGVEIVTKIDKLPSKSNMFDVSIASDNHRFWSNNILSHNSVTTIAFILWSVLFNDEYVVAVLANKGSLARELLGRLQKAYEHLPKWLQQGVVVWNKGSLELENGSKVFAYATSAAGVRGGSFNCVSGYTKITILDDYDRIFVIDIKNANSSKYKYNKDFKYWENSYMYYTVYKIKNNINGKEYIGYHQTNNLDDGYMGSGKLIKKAIEKYGIHNFSKEYIDIFDNREDAESLESFLVDSAYTLREDTYNIALGGNVRIMVGENNGFYGKTHTQDTLDLLRSKNVGRNITDNDDILIDGVIFNSFSHAKKELKITNGELKKLLLKDNNGYLDQHRQNSFISIVNEQEKRKKENRIAQSIFVGNCLRGNKKSKEICDKISKSLKGKPKTAEHIMKINNNPEKIRKTAEKHRGMKRSDESKIKMSLAKKGKSPHNKGKKYCYNPITKEKKLCFEQDIPNGWVFGFLSKEKNA